MQSTPVATFEDVGFSSTCHGPQDYQSLLMHRAAVDLLQDNPALQARLLCTLERWNSMPDPWSQSLRDEWLSIITERNWLRALEVSERGNQLRQASPMTSLLSNQARYDIIRHIRMMKENNAYHHAQS